MKLVLAIPVGLRSVGRAAQLVLGAVLALVVMYVAFGIVGTLVLAAELLWLGWILIKTAYGE